MTAYVLHRVGQSVYDLCLQVYGSLDLVVKFCQDNNVTTMEDIPQQVEYAYDTTLVKYEGNKNIYATNYSDNDYYVTTTGDVYVTTLGIPYIVEQ